VIGDLAIWRSGDLAIWRFQITKSPNHQITKLQDPVTGFSE
jgi:hypothetical protein